MKDVSSLSSTLYAPAPKFTVNTGWSSSLMETTVSRVVPALTLSGNGLPKLICTDSSSSSSVSCSAVKVKVCSVSVAPNVRLGVDMESSESDAHLVRPPDRMMTSRSGAALRVTVTVTSFSFSLGDGRIVALARRCTHRPRSSPSTPDGSSLTPTTVSYGHQRSPCRCNGDCRS